MLQLVWENHSTSYGIFAAEETYIWLTGRVYVVAVRDILLYG